MKQTVSWACHQLDLRSTKLASASAAASFRKVVAKTASPVSSATWTMRSGRGRRRRRVPRTRTTRMTVMVMRRRQMLGSRQRSLSAKLSLQAGWLLRRGQHRMWPQLPLPWTTWPRHGQRLARLVKNLDGHRLPRRPGLRSLACQLGRTSGRRALRAGTCLLQCRHLCRQEGSLCLLALRGH